MLDNVRSGQQCLARGCSVSAWHVKMTPVSHGKSVCFFSYDARLPVTDPFP